MRFPLNGAEGKDWSITTYFSAAHPGLDLAPLPAGRTGVMAYAPESGLVIESQLNLPVEGNYVKLKGDSGMFYYFGHFASRTVGVGQRVIEGQALGVLGMTGQANGIHTHHEVRTNSTGGQVDPVAYYKMKGDDMNVNQQQLDQIVWLATGLQASSNPGFQNELGNDLDTVLAHAMVWTETTNLHLDAEAYRSGATSGGKVLPPGNYQVK